MTAKTSDWRPGPTVCRCCLSEGCYKDISTEYFWMGKREVYAEMLTETLNVAIAYSKSGPNSNSRLICEPCISRLRDAHEFKRQVVDCEKTFLQHLDPGSSSVQEVEMTLEEVKIERVKQEKKVSDDEDFDDRVDFVVNDDSDDDLDNEPLMKLATKVPKKEKEMDILDLLDNSQITVKRKSTASSSKAKEPPAKKAKKREIVIKPSASKASASKTGEKKKKGYIRIDWTKTGAIIESTPTDGINIDSNKSNPTDTIKVEPIDSELTDEIKVEPIESTATDGTIKEPKKSTLKGRKKNKPTKTSDKKFCDSRYNAAIILECSNACPFRTYDNTFGCAYCTFKSPDFLPVRNHSKDHLSKDFASFLRSRKTDIECKADVTDLRCVLCQTTMKDISTLFEHLIETHNKPLLRKYRIGVVPYLLCDGYSCADCGLNFDWFRTLNKHVVTHYPQCICSECGQAFFGSSTLKYHLMGHSKKAREFKCSVCHESFPTLHRKRKHMISEHNIAIYKCPYCTETFKRFNERVAHLNKVHDKNINYPCKLCPKVFSSTTSRSIHTRYVHIKDNPVICEHCGRVFQRPDDLKEHMLRHTGVKKHQCKVCNKTFGRNRTLTEHMRIHNDDRRFACTYCNKAFVQKCSLKGHMKTHHPNA